MGDIWSRFTSYILHMYNRKEHYNNGSHVSSTCSVPGTVCPPHKQVQFLAHFTGKGLEAQEVKALAPGQAASRWQMPTEAVQLQIQVLTMMHTKH